MTTQEQYIQSILEVIGPHKVKRFRDGNGWVFPCPFCSADQKRESKVKEKCAALAPLAGSFQYVFSCQRGLRSGKGTCNRSMRFDGFLKAWNEPLYRRYTAEREASKRTYRPQFNSLNHSTSISCQSPDNHSRSSD